MSIVTQLPTSRNKHRNLNRLINGNDVLSTSRDSSASITCITWCRYKNRRRRHLLHAHIKQTSEPQHRPCLSTMTSSTKIWEPKADSLTHRPCPFDRLPRHVLVAIISRVGAQSCADLHRAKLTCRLFREAGEDPHTYRHASLPPDWEVQWFPHPRMELFLDRCFRFGNLESIFRDALLSYARGINEEEALNKLKETASKGHREATYIFGMKLLCAPVTQTLRQGCR